MARRRCHLVNGNLPISPCLRADDHLLSPFVTCVPRPWDRKLPIHIASRFHALRANPPLNRGFPPSRGMEAEARYTEHALTHRGGPTT